MSWFFEKINNIDKFLTDLRKREHSSKVRNEKGHIKTDTTEIQITKDLNEQL